MCWVRAVLRRHSLLRLPPAREFPVAGGRAARTFCCRRRARSLASPTLRLSRELRFPARSLFRRGGHAHGAPPYTPSPSAFPFGRRERPRLAGNATRGLTAERPHPLAL